MHARLVKHLTNIRNNQGKHSSVIKSWYYVGKHLSKGGKIPNQHSETKMAAKRTYQYYRHGKGDWEGPSPRKLSKMKAEKFRSVLRRREQSKRGTLLETSLPSAKIITTQSETAADGNFGENLDELNTEHPEDIDEDPAQVFEEMLQLLGQGQVIAAPQSHEEHVTRAPLVPDSEPELVDFEWDEDWWNEAQ